MATSLVSTGVQFPDSTIQTTAAGASGLTKIASINTTSGTTFDFTGLSSYTKILAVGEGLRAPVPGYPWLWLLVGTSSGFLTSSYRWNAYTLTFPGGASNTGSSSDSKWQILYTTSSGSDLVNSFRAFIFFRRTGGNVATYISDAALNNTSVMRQMTAGSLDNTGTVDRIRFEAGGYGLDQGTITLYNFAS